MKSTKFVNAFAGVMFAFGFSCAAVAQVKKCTLPDGTVRYSDLPCNEKETANNLAVPSTPRMPTEPNAGILPRLSPEAKAHEAKRAKARERVNAESAKQEELAKRSREANSEVRRIRDENYDPAKCQAARSQLEQMERKDPIGAKFEFDYFQIQQRASLYCGN